VDSWRSQRLEALRRCPMLHKEQKEMMMSVGMGEDRVFFLRIFTSSLFDRSGNLYILWTVHCDIFT
jgi:hypothetical protein